MCVIIYKKKGVQPMSAKEIEQAWTTNPDGAGLWHDGRVFKSMDKKAFTERCALIDKDDEAVYHFRIATHGTKKKDNCHPFNIGNGMILFHNGVLPFQPKADITDSEYFGRFILNPAVRFWPLSVQECLDKCRSTFGSTSKFVLIRNGKTYLSGWFQEHRGLKCSNLYWVPAPKPSWNYGLWKNSGKTAKQNNAAVVTAPKQNNYGSQRRYYGSALDEWYDGDDYYSRMYGYNKETGQYGYWQDGYFTPYAF